MGVPTTNRYYARGSLSYQEDEEAYQFSILAKGVVKLLRRYSGSKYFAHLLGPWNIIGPTVFTGGFARWLYVEAYTECKVVKVPWASLEQAIQAHPELALRLMTVEELRLIQYQELVECLLPRRTEVRLANLFSILAREFGEPHLYDRISIELTLTHQVLAEMIAATRESVTAAVKGLHKRELIQMKSKRIVILNPEKLAEIGRQ